MVHIPKEPVDRARQCRKESSGGNEPDMTHAQSVSVTRFLRM